MPPPFHSTTTTTNYNPPILLFLGCSYFGFSRLEVADDDGHLSGFTDFTVECWTYQTKYWESGSYAGIVSKGEGSDRTWKVCQEGNADSYSLLEVTDAGGTRTWMVKSSYAAPSADWVQASHDTVTEPSFAIYGSARENVETGMMLLFR